MVRRYRPVVIALALSVFPYQAIADDTSDRAIELGCATLTMKLPADVRVKPVGDSKSVRISFGGAQTRAMTLIDIRCEARKQGEANRKAAWDPDTELAYAISEDTAGASGGTAAMLNGVLSISGRTLGIECYTQGEDVTAKNAVWCLPYLSTIRLSQ